MVVVVVVVAGEVVVDVGGDCVVTGCSGGSVSSVVVGCVGGGAVVDVGGGSTATTGDTEVASWPVALGAGAMVAAAARTATAIAAPRSPRATGEFSETERVMILIATNRSPVSLKPAGLYRTRSLPDNKKTGWSRMPRGQPV